jgi:hypothetical protein
MKKIMAASVAAIVALGSAGSLVAHHSLGQFDTTRAVRVKGSVVLFERANPHTVLFIDQKGEDGQIHRWAVDGPSAMQLVRKGFDKEQLRAGDVVEVCGYVTKEGVDSQRTVLTEPVDYRLPRVTKSMSGRRMNGELLVMADGRQEPWSDYGHHKCFSPDYRDAHSR